MESGDYSRWELIRSIIAWKLIDITLRVFPEQERGIFAKAMLSREVEFLSSGWHKDGKR